MSSPSFSLGQCVCLCTSIVVVHPQGRQKPHSYSPPTTRKKRKCQFYWESLRGGGTRLEVDLRQRRLGAPPTQGCWCHGHTPIHTDSLTENKTLVVAKAIHNSNRGVVDMSRWTRWVMTTQETDCNSSIPAPTRNPLDYTTQHNTTQHNTTQHNKQIFYCDCRSRNNNNNNYNNNMDEDNVYNISPKRISCK